MKLPNRKFVEEDPTAGRNPMIIGLTGPSWSGKTFTALRLATGIQSIIGGDIWLIDSDAGRGKHYSKKFKYRYTRLDPPHGALHFLGSIEFCVGHKECSIVIIDAMSDEHGGDGGLLDQMDAFLDAKAGDDWSKRDALLMASQVKPKAERKYLNRRINQLSDVVFILLFRAADKIKPRKKGAVVPQGEEKMQHLGWTADTTSPIVNQMVVRFLLPPGSEGKPMFKPETKSEALSIKMPDQFKEWFKEGLQLDEEIGKKLAVWHLNNTKPTAKLGAPAPPAAENLEHVPGRARPPASIVHGKRIAQLTKWLNESTSSAMLSNRWGQIAAEPQEVLDGLLDTYTALGDEMKEKNL